MRLSINATAVERSPDFTASTSGVADVTDVTNRAATRRFIELDLGKQSAAISNFFGRNPRAIEQRLEQVCQRRLVGVLQMLTALELSAAAAHHQRRQWEVIVLVAVAHVAAVEQDRVIQDRAVAVGHRLELLQELGEGLGV